MKNPITLKSIKESIIKSNEAFEKMSNAEKRVQIAKDVILRMEAEQLLAYRNSLVFFIQNDEILDVNDEIYYKPLKEIINDDTSVTCEVCAKGAMLISYVGRVNDFSMEDCNPDGDEKILEFFTKRQMDLIEIAFEMTEFSWHDLKESAIEKAKLFGSKYDNSNERLRAICENIIENKGFFRP